MKFHILPGLHMFFIYSQNSEKDLSPAEVAKRIMNIPLRLSYLVFGLALRPSLESELQSVHS
jgi:hypothetical protein